MWVRYRRACLAFVCLFTLTAATYGRFYTAAAQDGSGWLVNTAPTLNKITELPSNTLPSRNNVDCALQAMVPAGQTVCTFASPLGTLTTSGQLYTGANNLITLNGPDYQSFFLPTTDSSVAVVALSSSGIGDYVGVYRHLTKSALQKHVSNQGASYDVDVPPDALITNPQTGQPLEMDTASIAFSANGQWMVADLPHRGLLRVDMSDLSTQLFAGPVEPSWYLGLASPPLAISDDGRYVAANTDIFGDGNLTVYDTSTCTDQLLAATNQEQYCAGKDIWSGRILGGEVVDQGLLSQQSDMVKPTYLRFVNDGNISFSAQYAVASGTSFKAANYVATVAGGTQHKLGLLGMGDSYISGQGVFDYRDGTDTSNDPCHLSPLSYPFILGTEDFNSYNSVACSGAQTNNLIGSDQKYTGQVTDNIPENKRDKSSILANFLPGYIYQQEFASTYLPQAILLSVGGDDVGFADIVKSCVANEGGGTCYGTYEDRAELVNEIDATYSKLVNTYTTLREQSGGARLYVVGYPQIAKPGGDCGLNVHLNSDEVTFSSQLISYLDGVVQKAAATAGVDYVDTQQAFDGHRLCEAGDKAVNGFTVGTDGGVTLLGKTINFIGSESYHPTPLGYQLLAQAIAAKTDNLSASMPAATAYAEPTLDPNAAILQDVPHTGRPLNQVANDDTITDDEVALRGDTQQVTVDSSQVQLQPGSQYQIVLHSEPVLLDEGGVDANGNISATVTISPDTTPGFHTLHVYGTDMAGEGVDVQKMIYVAASASDYDGDGVLNSADPCLLMPLSGQDADGDGIDDACDHDITTPVPIAKVTGEVSVGIPTAAPTFTQTPAASVTAQAAVSVTASSQQVTSSHPATAQTSGTVLGATTPVLPSSTAITVTGTTRPAAQVYRLNWLVTLLSGIGIITAITLLYTIVRRSK